ncbi:hypothetical protein EIN_268060 [Entamoeba invadens IP1]|uniref:Rho-GAP domain-containing protein n=1 Tax=Entamoeba invadens IP1 TaxID=370355 RepID=A0A0A1UE41_ENTIV|nr:hypothetical protein EIN_268060 [Entamoeba invadens IP1]ELP91070.1 hypothetical protein EIN_268060 [Entamoeba invadens IP1]|eukprot:XP_004257841.1 hypothetical protein EIN_268060 [Entamoeba invadens IP1]
MSQNEEELFTKVTLLSFEVTFNSTLQTTPTQLCVFEPRIDDSQLINLEKNKLIVLTIPKKSILTRFNSKPHEIATIQLLYTKVEDNLEEYSKVRGKTLCVVETIDTRKRKLVLCFDSKQDRERWKKVLNTYTSSAKNFSLFGVDLRDLHKLSGKIVPPFLMLCVVAIKRDSTTLFTDVASQTLSFTMSSIEHGETTELSPQVAFCVIKEFLRRLPLPVFHPLLEFLNPDNMKVDKMRRVVKTVTEEQRGVIDVVFELLNYLSKFDPQHFSPKTLAKAIGTSVAWDRTCAISSVVFEVVEFFIKSYQLIMKENFEGIGQLHKDTNFQMLSK